MAECEKLVKCPFFNDKMQGQPATAEMYKKRYCLGSNAECARYRVVQAGLSMPENLYPNMLDKALEYIQENQN